MLIASISGSCSVRPPRVFTACQLLAASAALALAPLASATLTSSGQITDTNGVPIDPTTITASSVVAIGNDMAGSVTVNGDPFSGNGITSVFSRGLRLGRLAGGDGTLTLTGIGASWNQDDRFNSSFFIGFEGVGTLNVLNGGRLTSDGDPTYLGGSSNRFSSTGSGNGTGIVNVSGTISQLVVNELHVGAATGGIGEASVSNGGQINTTGDWVYIGYHANSTGTLHLTGPTTTLVNAWGYSVAREGRGNLIIADGAQLTGTTSTQTSVIGSANGSLGRVIMTGNNTLWQDLSQSLTVADAGTALLDIGSGAKAEYGNNVVLGNSSTGRGQLVFTVGDDGTGSIKSGLLEVDGQLDIGDGFGLLGMEVAPANRFDVTFGDSFTLVDYDSYSGDNFLKTDLGVTGFLTDGGTVHSTNGVRFTIDLDADLDGQGDLGIVATVLDFLGDTNADTDVDDSDLGVSISSFTGPGGTGRDASTGDVDGDGDVDDSDLGATISFFTGPKQAAVSAVPEPASAGLLALGLLCLSRRRRGN